MTRKRPWRRNFRFCNKTSTIRRFQKYLFMTIIRDRLPAIFFDYELGPLRTSFRTFSQKIPSFWQLTSSCSKDKSIYRKSWITNGQRISRAIIYLCEGQLYFSTHGREHLLSTQTSFTYIKNLRRNLIQIDKFRP